MQKTRLEAFSDGVLAIIITIMVLELKVPHGTSWETLKPLIPTALSYIMSFVYIGIYWNNHHHMLQMTSKITGGILWANLHLLFWLSLFPFVTAWMGENNFAQVPTILYGIVLLLAALAFFTLQQVIIRSQGRDSRLKHAIGTDIKGKISPLLYIAGISSAFFNQWAAIAIFTLVAVIWVVPDSRIEKRIRGEED